MSGDYQLVLFIQSALALWQSTYGKIRTWLPTDDPKLREGLSTKERAWNLFRCGLKSLQRPGRGIDLGFHEQFHARVAAGGFRGVHVELEIIADGEGLEAQEVGDFMCFPSPDDRRCPGWRSGKLEAFVQEEMVESSQSYDLCMPIVDDRAVCLSNLIYW